MNLEEIALRMGYIDSTLFEHLLLKLPKSSYKEYCARVFNEIQSA